MADVRSLALRSAQDAADTDPSQDILGYFNDETEEFEEAPTVPDRVDVVHEYVWATMGKHSPFDPDTIRPPYYWPADGDERALNRATAAIRVKAAMTAVNAVWQDSYAMLFAAAMGTSFRAIGTRHTLDHKTAKQRVLAAIYRLHEQQCAEARRPFFVSWYDLPPGRKLPVGAWKDTPAGRDIAIRCQKAAPNMRGPAPPSPRDAGTRATLGMIGALHEARATLPDEAAPLKASLKEAVDMLAGRFLLPQRSPIPDWQGMSSARPCNIPQTRERFATIRIGGVQSTAPALF